jgi:hypothetical protein
VNDENGGAVTEVTLSYCSFHTVETVTGLHDGVGGSSTSSGKGFTSSVNKADRHCSPHVIVAKVYRR